MKFIVKRPADNPVNLRGPTPPKPGSKNSQKKAKLLAEGRRWVDFIIPIQTWELFVATCCGGKKPGEVLTVLIEKAVAEATS